MMYQDINNCICQNTKKIRYTTYYCPACRTTLIATRFRVAVICPIIQVPHCIRVFFYFVCFVFINHIFQLIMNYVPIVTFWIFTYHKIWILSIMFCFIWSYWIIMSHLQPNCCLKIDFQKVDQHAGGKWLIHDTKRRKDNQLQSLKLPCRISKLSI